MESIVFEIMGDGGYGSLLSQGRRDVLILDPVAMKAAKAARALSVLIESEPKL
jgi:hypothetical protein